MPDTLAYIINLENELGYMVVAADKRLGKDVLAHSNKSRISIVASSLLYGSLPSKVNRLDNVIEIIVHYGASVPYNQFAKVNY